MLTDFVLRNLKPRVILYDVADRDGMYVIVSPKGTITFLLDQWPTRDIDKSCDVLGGFWARVFRQRYRNSERRGVDRSVKRSRTALDDACMALP